MLRLDLRDALSTLARDVPGLELVKAGFALQLAGYDVACLDTRNVRRENRDPRAFRAPYTNRRLDAYLRETEGKAASYWDAWCEDVAHARGGNADDISALHLAVLPDSYLPF